MLRQIGIIICSLSIGEGHNEHVATLFERLVLVVAIAVTSGIWEARADIMNAVLLWPVACFLIDEKRVQKPLQDSGIRVDGNGMEWHYNIHCIDIPVRADLLHEDERSCRGVCVFDRTKGLPCRESSQLAQVRAASGVRIARDLGIKAVRYGEAIVIVVVEVLYGAGVRVEVVGPHAG